MSRLPLILALNAIVLATAPDAQAQPSPELAAAPVAEVMARGSGDGDKALQARRDELSQAQARLRDLQSERQSLETRHHAMNRRIEALKAEHVSRDPLFTSPSLLASPTLDTLLRDSQELADILTGKVEEERQLTHAVAQCRERLASALDREIGRLHADWDQADPASLREHLVPRLRALHAERRALLPPTHPATAPKSLPSLSAQDTDDPGLLLEMADAFLDSEDKLRREQQALARHIEQLENEQELERRLSSLMEEDALFDESERRISLTRNAHLYPEGATATASADSAQMSASDALSSGGTSAAGAPVESGESAMSSAPTSDKGAATSPGSEAIAPAGRSNLEILSSAGRARPIQGDWSESNSISALRAHQRYLEEKADEMRRKAEALTRQARDLL